MSSGGVNGGDTVRTQVSEFKDGDPVRIYASAIRHVSLWIAPVPSGIYLPDADLGFAADDGAHKPATVCPWVSPAIVRHVCLLLRVPVVVAHPLRGRSFSRSGRSPSPTSAQTYSGLVSSCHLPQLSGLQGDPARQGGRVCPAFSPTLCMAVGAPGSRVGPEDAAGCAGSWGALEAGRPCDCARDPSKPVRRPRRPSELICPATCPIGKMCLVAAQMV
jgi:hypothetical protein